MPIFSKAMYRFNVIPIKIPMVIFKEIKKQFQNCMEPQKTLNTQSNLEKKGQFGGIIIPDFKLYYKLRVPKTVWYGHKNRYID